MDWKQIVIDSGLAHAREIAGLTQADFAQAVGVSRSLVALVETGRKAIPLGSHTRWFEALSVALAKRERDRELGRKIIEELLPWSEEDERALEREKRRREAALVCP